MSPRIDRDRSTPLPTHQGRLALPTIGDLWLAWHAEALVSVDWVRDDTPPHDAVKVVKRIPAAYGRPLRDFDRGKPVDQGGYYHPDPVKTAAIMRPSPTLNAIIG